MSGIPSWVRPGVRVVCVLQPNFTINDCGISCSVVVGGTYLIDEVTTMHGIAGALHFDGFHPLDFYYYASFRPLVDDTSEREVEREIFNKLHPDAPLREKVDTLW